MTVYEIERWQMVAPGESMRPVRFEFDSTNLASLEVLVEVAGCGVCHTDLGFYYDNVRTRHELPLTLGHEISGRVVATGDQSNDFHGCAVVVPAVIPCGDCQSCKIGRGAICKQQFFPGNDDHGGFASHVIVPSRGLCVVDETRLAESKVDLASLAVVADAVTTPYQAILNSGLAAGDLAIFIGIGGVGTFGVQLARAKGARVVAIDVDSNRLEQIARHGAELCLVSGEDPREIKKKVREWAKSQDIPPMGWKIFETSGHPNGQSLAFSLLGYDAHLAVVGYTREKISLRLSNLMAFDATARGTWGCLPEHYPAVVEQILDGHIHLDSFIEQRPMEQINEIFEALHRHELKRRPILLPSRTE
jgi:6-hydroxycyclohex-1-ene-1-carbonyl-CoA dehydrogenase